MRFLFWFLINASQVLFFFFWSIIWQSYSIFSRLLFGDPRPALWVAHYIWAPVLLGITRSKIHVYGLEKVDLSKPHIFASNHQSTLDIAAALSTLPIPLRFVAKKELFYIPFLGWYMWATQMIFVDRKKGKEAIRSLKRAGDLIREGADIIAFPEGTRSDDGKVHPLKKGIFVVALEAGVPIIPLAIEGTRYVMPKNSFQVRPHDIHIAFGEPIETKGLGYEDRERLIVQTRQAMGNLLESIGGAGVSEHLQVAEEPEHQTFRGFSQDMEREDRFLRG
ncbi:1-acyl-sn-glycerol-3-phosphate acyltransferase [Myxococcota bacterium]|nr:1-acyl-sn-glycerol-3-phosphate acyltransferase [Myxococcota bacterium]